jgi:hypothetical protein
MSEAEACSAPFNAHTATGLLFWLCRYRPDLLEFQVKADPDAWQIVNAWLEKDEQGNAPEAA